MTVQQWVPRDTLFLTTEEVARRLRIHTRTVVNLIGRKELGAIKVGTDYRIPRPALEAYERRQATSPDVLEHLPPIAAPAASEVEHRIEEFEREQRMRTSDFLREYRADPDDPRWQPDHHRWAALVEALEAVRVAQ